MVRTAISSTSPVERLRAELTSSSVELTNLDRLFDPSHGTSTTRPLLSDRWSASTTTGITSQAIERVELGGVLVCPSAGREMGAGRSYIGEWAVLSPRRSETQSPCPVLRGVVLKTAPASDRAGQQRAGDHTNTSAMRRDDDYLVLGGRLRRLCQLLSAATMELIEPARLLWRRYLARLLFQQARDVLLATKTTMRTAQQSRRLESESGCSLASSLGQAEDAGPRASSGTGLALLGSDTKGALGSDEWSKHEIRQRRRQSGQLLAPIRCYVLVQDAGDSSGNQGADIGRRDKTALAIQDRNRAIAREQTIDAFDTRLIGAVDIDQGYSRDSWMISQIPKQCGDSVTHRLGFGSVRIEHAVGGCADLLRAFVEGREERLPLAPKMLVEGAQRDVGGVCDIAEVGGTVALDRRDLKHGRADPLSLDDRVMGTLDGVNSFRRRLILSRWARDLGAGSIPSVVRRAIVGQDPREQIILGAGEQMYLTAARVAVNELFGSGQDAAHEDGIGLLGVDLLERPSKGSLSGCFALVSSFDCIRAGRHYLRGTQLRCGGPGDYPLQQRSYGGAQGINTVKVGVAVGGDDLSFGSCEVFVVGIELGVVLVGEDFIDSRARYAGTAE